MASRLFAAAPVAAVGAPESGRREAAAGAHCTDDRPRADGGGRPGVGAAGHPDGRSGQNGHGLHGAPSDHGGHGSFANFEDTFDHVQHNLHALLSHHHREVGLIRAENVKLRAAIIRQSHHGGRESLSEQAAKAAARQSNHFGRRSLGEDAALRESTESTRLSKESPSEEEEEEEEEEEDEMVGKTVSPASTVRINRQASFAAGPSRFASQDAEPDEHDDDSSGAETSDARPRRHVSLASTGSEAAEGDDRERGAVYFSRRSTASRASAFSTFSEGGDEMRPVATMPRVVELLSEALNGESSDEQLHHGGHKPAMYVDKNWPERVSSSHDGQDWISRIVRSQTFELGFGFFILLNCATMGVEAEFVVTGGSQAVGDMLQISEHVFTAIFAVELLLRFRVFGWRIYLPTRSGNLWNFLDVMLVLSGVFFAWILPPILMIVDTTSDDRAVRMLTVLRAFRLVRLARVARNIESFSEAWLLIRGLTNSVRTLIWTVIVIFIIAYAFAIFGLAMLSKEFVRQYNLALAEAQTTQIDELAELVSYTGRMAPLLFTLIQLLTTDNWSEMVRLSMKYIWWSWMFWYTYLGIVVIVLMNLVTAIIVENALINSRQDEDKQLVQKDLLKKQELNKLEQLFLMMDVDGDGTLSWTEFELAFHQREIINKWKLLDFQPDECMDLFKLLDRGDGCIPLTDFHDGLLRMKGTAQSKDLFQVMKYVEDLTTVVSDLAEQLAYGGDRGPRHSAAQARMRRTTKRDVTVRLSRRSTMASSAADEVDGDRGPRSRRTTLRTTLRAQTAKMAELSAPDRGPPPRTEKRRRKDEAQPSELEDGEEALAAPAHESRAKEAPASAAPAAERDTPTVSAAPVAAADTQVNAQPDTHKAAAFNVVRPASAPSFLVPRSSVI